MSFKIGDKVRVINSEAIGKLKISNEDIGTVQEKVKQVQKNIRLSEILKQEIGIDNYNICVEFEKNIAGYSGGGIGKVGHCWHIDMENVEKINNKIVGDYEVLDKIKSETSSKEYTIKRNIKTKKISCNCPSWIYMNGIVDENLENCKTDRMCKHIKKWMEKTSQGLEELAEINYRKEDKAYDNILTKLEKICPK